MTVLPPDLAHGLVIGRYILTVADGADEDRYPDTIPARGSIFFSPHSIVVHSFTNPPTTVVKHTPEAVLDSNGNLTDNGVLGIWLAVGHYTVTFKLSTGTIPPFKIHVTEEHTYDNPLDLTLATPLQPSISEKFVINEQVYTDSLQAVDEAYSVVIDAYTYLEEVRLRSEAEVLSGRSWSGAVSLTRVAPILVQATLTGDVTLTLPTTVEEDRALTYSLVLTQDGTGGHTLTVPGALAAYGVPVQPSPDPGSTSVIHFLWTGKKWVALMAAPHVLAPSGWEG